MTVEGYRLPNFHPRPSPDFYPYLTVSPLLPPSPLLPMSFIMLSPRLLSPFHPRFITPTPLLSLCPRFRVYCPRFRPPSPSLGGLRNPRGPSPRLFALHQKPESGRMGSGGEWVNGRGTDIKKWRVSGDIIGVVRECER